MFPVPPPTQSDEAFVADLSEGAEAGVYLALLELIDEGLIITTDELIIDVNSAACALLEREYRELVGQPLYKLFCSDADFLAARERLLVHGQRRSEERFCLPGDRACTLKVVCAPRLRPGIHALVLSPLLPQPAALLASSAACAQPASVTAPAAPPDALFAKHLDPAQALQARPASLFAPQQWPHPRTPELEQALWQALEKQQLRIELQALVDSREWRWQGGEALLRWQHPTQGLFAFGQFRPALRDPHLIACLGDWVLAEACSAARQWPQAGGKTFKLAVNVATEQLLLDGFADELTALLKRSDFDPGRLELDIDESVLETDNSAIADALFSLSALGVSLAIDDFGRGLSSIPRLRRYPVASLKLDPSLIAGVGRCEDSEASVEAIASMGRSLGLAIVARGVKTAAQRDFLAALGCQLQQGPLYGSPLSPADFSARLEALGTLAIP